MLNSYYDFIDRYMIVISILAGTAFIAGLIYSTYENIIIQCKQLMHNLELIYNEIGLILVLFAIIFSSIIQIVSWVMTINISLKNNNKGRWAKISLKYPIYISLLFLPIIFIYVNFIYDNPNLGSGVSRIIMEWFELATLWAGVAIFILINAYFGRFLLFIAIFVGLSTYWNDSNSIDFLIIYKIVIEFFFKISEPWVGIAYGVLDIFRQSALFLYKTFIVK